MSVKVKTSTSSKIDLKSVIKRRIINIDFNELLNFIKTSVVPISKAPVMIKNNDGFIESSTNKKVKTIAGRWEYPKDYNYPDFIIDFIKQIKLSYNLKNEVAGYQIMLYPPCKENGKGIEYKIPPAGLQILTRVIFSIGHREVLKCEIKSCVEEILISSGDSFNFPIGYGSALDITFNDSTDTNQKNRDNRKIDISKNPTKRILGVIDFYYNANVLSQFVKDELVKIAKGNMTYFNKLKEKIYDSLGLNKSEYDDDEIMSELIDKF